MKKLFTSLMAMALTVASSMAATTFTFQDGAAGNQSKDGYTIIIDKGAGNNAPVFNDNYGEFRLYAKNTITVSGVDVTRVSIVCSKQGDNPFAQLTANTGNLTSGGESTSREDLKVDVWTGSAGSVTFTVGDKGQRIIHRLVINGDASDDEVPTVPGNPDVPSILDPDYVYQPVTIIEPNARKVQGDAYSFIENNIQVSCTKGAIVTNEYFSAHAGFDMTFTATQPIKGIVINGMVKKEFTATASAGNISYLTPAEDQSADPVVVITDVNSKSVTISCVKQLRCYEVEIYFQANPEATVGGGGSGNPAQEVDLVFDFADCVYESVISELWGEPNYSIYLYRDDDIVKYFALDLYPVSVDDITGTYSWMDYSLGDFTYYSWGEGEDDFTWGAGGEVIITKNGDVYTIKGAVFCEDNTLYNINYTGKMAFYTDDEYYEGGEDDSAVDGILADKARFDSEAPMYDLLGRKLTKTYRGIYIQNGKKFVGKYKP